MKKRMLWLLMLILLTGCGAQTPALPTATPRPGLSARPTASPVTPSPAPSASAVPSPVTPPGCSARSVAAAQRLLADMTLEERIGQMLFLAFRQDEEGKPLRELTGAALEELRAIQPGGVILFGENIETVAQVRRFIRVAQGNSRCPPFIAVDQEGGKVQRIKHTAAIPATDVPPMLEVGRAGDPELTREVGRVLGRELAVFGFNMNFAPVCDAFTNPQNTVIGDRAFSSDPQQAAGQALALAQGLEAENILPVCKHFPGHGDTREDTHEGLATSRSTLAQLRQRELIPFQAQIDAGAQAILVAHISLPEVTGSDLPASLSPQIITGLLREEMGFQGLVITDAMDMGAVARRYGSGEAARRAVEAGADMVLMPQDPGAAFAALVEAARSGELSRERIDASVLRILALKLEYGLDQPGELPDAGLLGCPAHRAAVEAVAGR